jgi:hypothetical protein
MMKLKKSKALMGAGAVLVTVALVSPHISSAFRQENAKTVETKITQSPTPTPTPTRTYAKVAGIWTYDCEIPEQRPETIILTCGDGGMLVMGIKWKTWTKKGATGTGLYSENMCEPNCAEGTRINVPVIVKLGGPFEYKGRNVLKTLDIRAVGERRLPDGAREISWDVSEFAVSMDWDLEE